MNYIIFLVASVEFCKSMVYYYFCTNFQLFSLFRREQNLCSVQGVVVESARICTQPSSQPQLLEQVELGWAKRVVRNAVGEHSLAKVDPAEKLQNCNSADSSSDVAKLRVPALQFCKTRRRKIAFLLNKLKISLKAKDFLMKGYLNLAKIIIFKQ